MDSVPIPIPIPITQLPISKERWLTTRIQYEDNYYIRDVLETICKKSYQWIASKNDLYLTTDYETFYKYFLSMIYEEYFCTSKKKDTFPDISEYFELKYLEEVNQLFKECLQLEKVYNVNIFKNKDFINFFYFLGNYIDTFDEEEEDEDEDLFDEI